MRTLLKRPNPLAYPGTAPGFDPTHVASKLCRLSVAGVSNLLLGTPPSTLTASTKVDAILGPVTVYTGTQVASYAGLTDSSSALTYGMICLSNSPNNVAIAQTGGGTASMVLIFVAGNVIKLGFVNTGNTSTGLIVPTNPFFVATSTNGTTLNTVTVDLVTGAIQSSSVADGGNIGSGNGGNTYSLGSDWNGASFVGHIAAAMANVRYMPLAQLLQWAQDPWSFWYPQKFDLTQMLKAPAAGGSTATATSIGTSVASGIGASTVLSTATSTGTSTASGIAISTATSMGTSSGTGTATGISFSANTAVATSSGSSTAVGVTISTATSVGTSSGTGTALGVSISTVTSVGTSSGSGTATGVSISTVTSVGTSSGVGTALAIGSVLSNVATASGFGTATGVGASLILSVGTSSGISIVTAISGGGGGGRQWRWQEGQKQLQNKPPSDTVKQSAAILSSRGGHARAASLTATQRTNIASTAAKARWK